MPHDLESIWQTAEAAAPYALAILVALTVLSHALQAGARALQRWATTTPAQWDDAAAARLVRWADGLAAALEWIAALLPRVDWRALAKVLEALRRNGPRGPGGPSAGAGAVVVILALVVASSAICACGSSAALATPIQTIPQHVTLELDASDGGTITIGGECSPTGATPPAPLVTLRGDCGGGSVWLDARGGGAGAETQQSGTEIDTAVDAAASVAASGSGSASSGPASSSGPVPASPR